MKKFLQILAVILSTFFVMNTALVQAQDVVNVDEVPSTGAPAEAGAPDTGIAPSENRVVQNALVFTGGSLLGVAVGLGVITLKKRANQE